MTVAAVTGSGTSPVGTSRPVQTAATRAAASFERMLLEQLTKQLTATAAPEDASPATAAYRDMLPGTMADALSQAGGIGIAAHLTAAATGAGPDVARAPRTDRSAAPGTAPDGTAA